MNSDDETNKDETSCNREHYSLQLGTISQPAALKAIHRALHECLIIQIHPQITQINLWITERIPSARVRKSRDENRNGRRCARANDRQAC